MLVVGGGITGVGRRARRRDPRAAHRARRTRRPRVGHVVEVVEARARRDPLPPAARGRPRVRSARRAPDPPPDRAAPRAGAAVPAPRVHPRRPAPPPARAPARHHDVGLRPHRRPAHRQAAQARLEGGGAAATCRRCTPTASRRRTCTTTPRPTTPGSRSPSRAPPPTTAPRSRTTRALVDLDKGADGRVQRRARRRRRPDDRRAREARRERDRRVVRRHARARRGNASVVDPARQGRAHHGAVVAGAEQDRGGDPGSQGQAGRCSSSRGAARAATTSSRTSAPPTPTTTVRSTIRRSRPTTSSISCARSTARSPRRSPKSDILGTWAGLRPLVRAATSERTADLSRRHSVRASDSGVITVTGGKLTTYRRMAADTVDAAVKRLGIDGRRPSRTKRVRLHGAAGWDAPGLPADLATRYGGDTREVLALLARPTRASPSRSCPASPTRRPRSCTRRAPRWPAPSTTCFSRRTRARLLARDASAAAAAGGRGADGGRARLGRRRTRPSGRAVPALIDDRTRPRAACPRPRSTRSPSPRRSPDRS